MRNLQAPLCSDTQGIPSGDALLDRMHAVAMEYGVRGIQQGAVRLMFSALEVSYWISLAGYYAIPAFTRWLSVLTC